MILTNEEGERPDSHDERRSLAEKKYQKRYAKFKTHNFLDWGILTQVREKNKRKLTVPPYCWRFDEYLGYWLGSGSPMDAPGTLERFFPKPDSIDLAYLDDVLDELNKVSAWTKEPYRASKGSKVDYGPYLNRDYDANIARAKKWVEETRAELARKDSLEQDVIAVLRKKSQRVKAVPATTNKSPWDGLFLKGFTVAKLTDMLVALGLLTEDRQHVNEIKPRHWRAVIEALRDNKSLVHTDAPRLYQALTNEFAGGEGHFPQIRTLQDAFDPKNADVKKLQVQATAWLKAN